jgi:hypothetical protein
MLIRLLMGVDAVRAESRPPQHLTVMFLIRDTGGAGSQTAETTLIRAFERQGFSVLDREVVAQALRRQAALLELYEVEAAKRLGSRLGADLVISGVSRTRVREKTYSTLGGKTVTVSQANITAKAVLASTGKVLAAETALARSPFDMTGDVAAEKAAMSLAEALLQGIQAFLNAPTTDYRLLVLNLTDSQARRLQDILRTEVAGVQGVREDRFVDQRLELDVTVDKAQDIAFKSYLFSRLSAHGLGRFKVLAREGTRIYLQRTGRPSRHTRVLSPPSPRPREGGGGRPKPQPELPPGPSGSYRTGYGKSWAVVIGINQYQKWPELVYAVKDARAVAQRLSRLGFDKIITITDRDATQRNILRVLGDELYAKTKPEDRVFIFFAGHGQTQDLPRGDKMGYIIPVDGDRTDYYSTAISMRQLQDLSDRLRAKHIFYAMDSCFSGLLLRLRGVPGTDFAAYTSSPVRQVLTAGSEGEEVVEVKGHGLFTRALLTGLDGHADTDGDGYITASELYEFLTPRILKASHNRQNPLFGRLDQGRGEFVFMLDR